MQAAIYTWNIPSARLSPLCAELRILLRPVAPEEAHLPVARLPERAPAPGLLAMPFQDGMLLMAGLSPALRDQFLDRLRSVYPVRLKAVMTPHNAFWDSVRLHRELSREAGALRL